MTNFASSASSATIASTLTEVADLTQALGEAAVELRVWKKSAEGRLGPSWTLEVIRVEAGMSPRWFCALQNAL